MAAKKSAKKKATKPVKKNVVRKSTNRKTVKVAKKTVKKAVKKATRRMPPADKTAETKPVRISSALLKRHELLKKILLKKRNEVVDGLEAQMGRRLEGHGPKDRLRYGYR